MLVITLLFSIPLVSGDLMQEDVTLEFAGASMADCQTLITDAVGKLDAAPAHFSVDNLTGVGCWQTWEESI